MKPIIFFFKVIFWPTDVAIDMHEERIDRLIKK